MIRLFCALWLRGPVSRRLPAVSAGVAGNSSPCGRKYLRADVRRPGRPSIPGRFGRLLQRGTETYWETTTRATIRSPEGSLAQRLLVRFSMLSRHLTPKQRDGRTARLPGLHRFRSSEAPARGSAVLSSPKGAFSRAKTGIPSLGLFRPGRGGVYRRNAVRVFLPYFTSAFMGVAERPRPPDGAAAVSGCKRRGGSQTRLSRSARLSGKPYLNAKTSSATAAASASAHPTAHDACAARPAS